MTMTEPCGPACVYIKKKILLSILSLLYLFCREMQRNSTAQSKNDTDEQEIKS